MAPEATDRPRRTAISKWNTEMGKKSVFHAHERAVIPPPFPQAGSLYYLNRVKSGRSP